MNAPTSRQPMRLPATAWLGLCGAFSLAALLAPILAMDRQITVRLHGLVAEPGYTEDGRTFMFLWELLPFGPVYAAISIAMMLGFLAAVVGILLVVVGFLVTQSGGSVTAHVRPLAGALTALLALPALVSLAFVAVAPFMESAYGFLPRWGTFAILAAFISALSAYLASATVTEHPQ